MDLEHMQRQRNNLEAKANQKLEDGLNKLRESTDLAQKPQKSETAQKVQDALNDMREDISEANDMVARKVNKISERDSQESPPPQPQPQEEPIKPSTVTKPLVYFSYPMEGYEAPPAWTTPLCDILISLGYLVYNPWEQVDSQFAQKEIPVLDGLQPKIVKSLCSVLAVPEEVLLPFEAIWKILHKGDQGDNYGIVFQNLWFLIRSSLVICDLTRGMVGAGTAQELLYSKQIDIPVVGFLSPTGQLNPYTHRSVTAFFSGKDLHTLLPMIRGYAPL